MKLLFFCAEMADLASPHNNSRNCTDNSWHNNLHFCAKKWWQQTNIDGALAQQSLMLRWRVLNPKLAEPLLHQYRILAAILMYKMAANDVIYYPANQEAAMTLASYLIIYNTEVLWHSGTVMLEDLVCGVWRTSISLFTSVPDTFQWCDLIGLYFGLNFLQTSR